MDENSNSQSSSESVEVNAGLNQDGSPMMNGHMDADHYSDDESGRPYIEIIEQPQQRGFRFRYECEGPSHGGLQGNRSEKFKKTVPTIKIKNYSGHAQVIVSLVTHEAVPKPHAHKLVGKHCQDGLCTVDVKPGNTQVSFSNLCVQHVTRRKAAEVLEHRILNAFKLQKQVEIGQFKANFKPTDEEIKRAKQEAQAQSKNMALNVVRLCFQVFLMDDAGNQTAMLSSVVSEPIYDSKAPGANALKICRMDKYSGCCTGNEEVFLLCEKVQREDIMVKFVEQDEHGTVLWEAQGHFGPFDVHRQFAIVFKTPEYRDTNIEQPVNVLVMLMRKSDSECSDPKSFTYYPKSLDKEDIDRKRKKRLPGNQYDPNRGGFRDMDPSNNHFGGQGKGGSGDIPENGMQNGSTLPNFHDMNRNPQFGGQARYILKPHRQNPQAKIPRELPQMNPDLVNFLTNPHEHLYEEVRGQDILHSLNSPPYMDTNQTSQSVSNFPATNGHMNMNTQYDSNVPMRSPHRVSESSMQGSPHSVNGSVHMSPNHINPMSPQEVMNPSQSMQETSQTCIQATQINNYVQQPVICTDNIKVEQVPIGEPVQPVTQSMITGSPSHVTQPVQDSSLEIDHIAHNFNFFQQFEYGRFPQQATVSDIRNSLHAFDSFHNSCSYQARGASEEPINLQELGFDFPDSQKIQANPGYDEPDCTLVQQPMRIKAHPLTVGPKISPKAEDYVHKPSKLDLEEVKYVEAENIEVKEHANIDTERLETNFSVTPLRAVDVAVQTDMDHSTHNSLMRTAEALQYYAASGDIRSLLMVQKFLMLVQDQDGDLPLHTSLINQKYEVFQNLLDVMRFLPDSYSRINAYNFHHQTPLHLAVLTNQPRAVDLLIRAGGDTTLVDRNGYTPAHLAVLYKHTQCLKNLLKYVRRNTDLKKPFPELNLRCYSGFTPAHLAAQTENLEAMKLICYGKADINLQDGKSGHTALHHAVECDDLSLAAYLILQAGAGVNIKRFDGNTTLHIACGRGNVGMVALLMAGGADPNIENDDTEDSDDNSSVEENNNDKSDITVEGVIGESNTESVEKGETDNERVTWNDENGVSSDEERSIKTSPRKGLLPADFADGNDKILRVLNGEPYRSLHEYSCDNQQVEGRDLNSEQKIDMLTSLNYSKVESGLGSLSINSTESDLDKLDIQTRLGLSKLLDTNQSGSDWSALAEKLGLGHYMAGHLGEQSPTGLLLTCLEHKGGTVSMLCNALAAIKREDALSLLKSPLPGQQQISPNTDKFAHKDPQLDSGTGLEMSLAATES